MKKVMEQKNSIDIISVIQGALFIIYSIYFAYNLASQSWVNSESTGDLNPVIVQSILGTFMVCIGTLICVPARWYRKMPILVIEIIISTLLVGGGLFGFIMTGAALYFGNEWAVEIGILSLLACFSAPVIVIKIVKSLKIRRSLASTQKIDKPTSELQHEQG